MMARYCKTCGVWVAGSKLRDCIRKHHAIDWNRGTRAPKGEKIVREVEREYVI